jgi:ribose transport system ATP-binding protein
VDPKIVHDLGIRFVHQELHLVSTFTVTEAVFMGHEITNILGVDKKSMHEKAERTLRDILGVTINGRTLIRDLSPAERKLVQIARALVDEGAKLVVFDEPTAPLAANEVERVLGAIRRLRDNNISTLYVSHYLGEITELCDRVSVFRDGKNSGNVDQVTSTTAKDLIRMMVGKELDQLFPVRKHTLGSTSLQLKNASDGSKFSDVNLEVKAGEIVGIVGLLGSGSEEIVDSLVGLRKIKTGTLVINQQSTKIKSPAMALKKSMVLIPRDRRNDGLLLNLNITNNINLSTLDMVSSLGIVSSSKSKQRAIDVISKLNIRPAEPNTLARLLSGGNQQKVVLARSLAAKAKILVLDEPTIGVDVGAKSEIYKIISDLASSGAAILISSNDPAEILGLCDRVFVVLRGKVVSSHNASELSRDELVERMTGSKQGESNVE